MSRDLAALGHRMVGIDPSAKLIAAARELSSELEFVEADAADLPLEDESVDLAVAFMTLMDVDDMQGAVREASRVLDSNGRLALAVVHPMDSAHEHEPDGNLVLTESYFDRRVYRDEIERCGLRMVFESRHWTLQDYFDAVLAAGFRIEALREVGDPGDPRWSGYPLYLHLLAAKASQPG